MRFFAGETNRVPALSLAFTEENKKSAAPASRSGKNKELDLQASLTASIFPELAQLGLFAGNKFTF